MAMPDLEADTPLDPRIVPLRSRRGVITNLANDIIERLSYIDYGAKANRFLKRLMRNTFGDTGKHEHWGHDDPGLWCTFDLSAWVGYIAVSKSTLIHLRNKLVADGLIWFEPDIRSPGRGRLGWNTDFTQWLPLLPDYPKWGGQRTGAGRPKNQDNNASLTKPIQDNNASLLTDIQDNNGCLPGQEIKITMDACQDEIMITMDACNETGRVAASDPPLRKGSTKKGSRTEATASGARAATPPQNRGSPGKGQRRSDREPEAFVEFQRFCFALIREQQQRIDGLRVGAQAKALFNATNGPYTHEQVEACWRILIRDPYYNATKLPCISDIHRKIEAYLNDPVGFAAAIDTERQRRERSNGYNAPGASRARSAAAPIRAKDDADYSDGSPHPFG